MAEFKLHCFYESGNSYKAALMLDLIGADWEPVFVRYFDGETQGSEWRDGVNEMGEAPVLEHGATKLSQSGVILTYLANLSGQFGATQEDEQREILRWILFDNHKFTSYFATLRFLYGIRKTGDTEVVKWLRGRTLSAWGIVDKHLETREFLVANRPTIADLSLAGYVYYDEPTGIDVPEKFPRITAWAERIKALPGWKSPADLMPRGE